MLKSRVKRSELPTKSLLHNRLEDGDFLDCFSVVSDLSPRQAAEIITSFPAWAKMLVRLRGILVAPFGLDNTGPEATDKVGIFPVEHDDASEVIAGFDDRHLDFRVSVFSEDGRISLATWVHRHNLGGRLYLAIILPFHILIARNALARVSRASA
ncbi:DUF2867 domain-containing protein [Ruegeria conchae]|uniref:Uncharacterized protein DUF2867 n=1 Tax=Ruegeria conchae TaxID=981384 RepID=A0A497ZMJ2_9RHOB|nr:DUF2867 domain-containing protein [Ruegeria conchae]RLK08508.1 uncharacterized protein DUF2867 [Ruegeria conchae]